MIPFTQYLRPDGRKKETGIERPEEVEALAHSFIEAGGKFEAEVLSDGQVSLTACQEIDGEWQDVAIEICANGPGLPETVDRLVHSLHK